MPATSGVAALASHFTTRAASAHAFPCEESQRISGEGRFGCATQNLFSKLLRLFVADIALALIDRLRLLRLY
jgi:hypothetical protein